MFTKTWGHLAEAPSHGAPDVLCRGNRPRRHPVAGSGHAGEEPPGQGKESLDVEIACRGDDHRSLDVREQAVERKRGFLDGVGALRHHEPVAACSMQVSHLLRERFQVAELQVRAWQLSERTGLDLCGTGKRRNRRD